MPFVWPKSSPTLQLRVIICFLLLAAGRVSNVYVPILYKQLGKNNLHRVIAVLRTVSMFGMFTLWFLIWTIWRLIVDSMSTTDIVFRWDLVLIFVAIKFLQGGTTGGFLNNFRTFLWIPVQQYTTRETEVLANFVGLSGEYWSPLQVFNVSPNDFGEMTWTWLWTMTWTLIWLGFCVTDKILWSPAQPEPSLAYKSQNGRSIADHQSWNWFNQ